MTARAWALTDLGSGEYLIMEDATERLSMGSTDKIMVALLALEQVGMVKASPEDEVTVSEDAAGVKTGTTPASR